jgi:hypothetical protein
MTDHPRFRLIEGEHGERHRHSQAAPAVDLAFYLADCWLGLARLRHIGHRAESQGVSRCAPQLLRELPQESAAHQRLPHGERG